MGLLLQISLISVFLAVPCFASGLDTYIQCYSNLTTDGFRSGEKCLVRFPLDQLDGCTLTSPAYFLAANPRYPVKKSMNEEERGSYCDIYGNELFCFCLEDKCNKNATIIWNTFLHNANLDVSLDCRDDIGTSLYKEIRKWNKVGPSIQRTTETIKCYNSETNTEENGLFCSAEYELAEGTCYIVGEGTMKAENNTQEICETSANKIKITCSTNGCNNDLDALKAAIVDLPRVSANGIIDSNCKRQLERTIGGSIGRSDTVTTNSSLENTLTTNSSLEDSDDCPGYIPNTGPVKLCTGKKCSPKYAVAFLFDASQETFMTTNRQSIYAMSQFIQEASTLLGPDDVVFPIGYGGELSQDTKEQGRIINCERFKDKSGSPAQVKGSLEKIIKDIEATYPLRTVEVYHRIEHSISIHCAVYPALSFEFFPNMDFSFKKLIVHIGTGNTKEHKIEWGLSHFNQFKRTGVQVISIAPKWGNTKQMKESSTNSTTDYFEIEDLVKKSLNKALAKRILRSGC